MIEVFVFTYGVSVSYEYTLTDCSPSLKIRAENITASFPADTWLMKLLGEMRWSQTLAGFQYGSLTATQL